jgi:glyoxylase I family protein
MIDGIEHTAIASPDPAKLATWYVDTLGFRINYQSSTSVMLRSQNGYMLELITADGDAPAAGMKTPGLRHLAISVSDFDAVYAALQARGVRFVAEPVEHKGNRVVFFEDPEGNLLHLLRRSQPLA